MQLAEILEIDLDVVRPESHLRDDLDADVYVPKSPSTASTSSISA